MLKFVSNSEQDTEKAAERIKSGNEDTDEIYL